MDEAKVLISEPSPVVLKMIGDRMEAVRESVMLSPVFRIY